jgi:hypothetical protein
MPMPMPMRRRTTAAGDAACDEHLRDDVDVADRTPGRFANEVDGLTEADRPQAGELVGLVAPAASA